MRVLPNLNAYVRSAETGTATATPVATNELPKTLQDVDTMYFPPSELAGKGVPAIQHISTLTNPIFNGDWPTTGEFPASHGLLILPIGETVEEKGEKKRVTKFVVCAAVPTLDALLADEKGREYVERSTQSAFSAKIRNALIRAEDVNSIKLPLSIEEFIERAERGAADQGLATYKAIASKLVKALGNKGIATNVALLRQILSSAAFAKALMPKVNQNVWVKVLNTAKAFASQEKLPVTIFDHWISTRDQVAVEVAMDDIDL